MLQCFLPPVPAGGTCLRFGDGDFEAIGFSDGSVKGTKGVCAYVLDDRSGNFLTQGVESVNPTRDSNVPELQGIHALLVAAQSRGIRRLVCCTDSYQSLQALQGAVKGKASRYSEISAISAMVADFDALEFRNVANRHNRRADALCTAAQR